MPGIRGFVAQGLDGQKKALTAAVRSYPPGSYTFVASASGVYRIAMWGAGDHGGGASGAFVQAERPLAQGQRVAVVVANSDSSPPPLNTTVTLPNGEVLTAGSASGTSTGGTATATGRGDIAINGSKGNDGTAQLPGGGDNGGAAGTNAGPFVGGAGAPGYGGYRGGNGGNAVGSGTVPAGGSPGGGGATPTGVGGGGLVIISRVKMRR